MDREAALRQRAWSGHPRAYQLQTLAALEGAVNDILHELGPTFVDFHVGPRLMPMAGSYPPSRFAPCTISTSRCSMGRPQPNREGL